MATGKPPKKRSPRKSPHGDGWYPAATAARVSGLTTVMLNYLSRTGMVEPSCSCPRGHGRPRHYWFAELVALRLVSRLSAMGVSPLRIRRGLQSLRQYHPEITMSSLPASHLVTDGQDIYLRGAHDSLERLVDGQYAFAFVIELAQLQQEVLAALAA